jgi:hypothetical protein
VLRSGSEDDAFYSEDPLQLVSFFEAQGRGSGALFGSATEEERVPTSDALHQRQRDAGRVHDIKSSNGSKQHNTQWRGTCSGKSDLPSANNSWMQGCNAKH